MEDREWIDITHLGSNYEIHMDRYGNYRHRALSHADPGTGREFKVEHPWIPGHPPEDKA